MKINEIMTDNVLSIRKDHNFTEACRLMQQLRIHHLPVVDEKEALIGMFSANDALKAFSDVLVGRNIESEAHINDMIGIEDCMTKRNLYFLDSEADVRYALTLMQEFDVRSVPVVEEGVLVGIVTSKDILNHTTSLVS